MIMTLRLCESYLHAVEILRVQGISSFLVYDETGAPEMVGMEYSMPEGTAWTFATKHDKDFFKILSASGVLNTRTPGRKSGVRSILCTPFLGKGTPRWFPGVVGFVASTKKGEPCYLSLLDKSNQLITRTSGSKDFNELRSKICSPELSVNIF